MTVLLKELTAELLKLVLNEKVIHIDGIKENCLWFYCDDEVNVNAMKIDTLTRLMKEWLTSQNIAYTSSCYLNALIVSLRFYNNEFNCMSKEFSNMKGNVLTVSNEFEVILQATHWVAKEKGLL